MIFLKTMVILAFGVYMFKFTHALPLQLAKRDKLSAWVYILTFPMSLLFPIFNLLFYYCIDYVFCKVNKVGYEKLIRVIHGSKTDKELISCMIHISENKYYRDSYMNEEEILEYENLKRNEFVF